MKVSLVVPVFNEEATIPIFYKTVREFEELKPYEVEIVFINDGSKDATESIINKIAASDPLVIPLSFTRNFGKEPALFAGLDYATGDAVIPIDVDLQDPIEVIPHLIEKWQAGADMVLAKRSDRSTDVIRNSTAGNYGIWRSKGLPASQLSLSASGRISG